LLVVNPDCSELGAAIVGENPESVIASHGRLRRSHVHPVEVIRAVNQKLLDSDVARSRIGLALAQEPPASANPV